MATISKTQGTSVLSLQSLASNSELISSAIDVSTKLAGVVFIHFGRRTGGALNEGVFIRVEGSAQSSGDGHWYPLAQFQTQAGAVTSQAVSGTCNSGQNVVAMTSTTGMSADPLASQGHIVYIDNGTIANSEWHRVKTVTTNTSITLEDNLVHAQTSSTVFPNGEMYVASLDFTAVGRIRVVVNANNTGQAIAIEVELVTGDSIA